MKLLETLQKDLVQAAEEGRLLSDPQRHPGLTSREAEKRLLKDGENRLSTAKRLSPFKIFAAQFKNILIVILLISTVVSAWMGEYGEAAAIAVIVILNAFLGFLQEFRTERTLEALREMAAPTARVYRDGVLCELPASELVSGDVVELEAGDKVPADGVLLKQSALAADEAILTGESVPVEKLDESAAPGDPLASLFMGSIIVKGRGRMRVTATGMRTKMGGIAGMISTIEEEATPLQKKLNELGRYIAIGCLIICAIVSGAGLLQGEEPIDMLITGVSLAVAAVPEGLPAIVTIALALAVKRMVKRRALIRRLHAVETLGCASVICSDKTGTLTENRMTVQQIALFEGCYDFGGDRLSPEASEKPLELLLDCAILCSNASLPVSDDTAPSGDPTETALLAAAEKAGHSVKAVRSRYSRIKEDPFDSVKKYMAVTVQGLNGERILFVKGAPDILLERCGKLLTKQGEQLLGKKEREQILSQNEAMAQNALRVLGFAFRPLRSGESDPTAESLTFLGLSGMIDPPRKSTKKSVSLCTKAGIRTVMITGDHKTTAQAIASQVGIFRKGDRVLTGDELDALSDSELDLLTEKTSVYARVSPHHKLRIVRAFKRAGHIAAMTGDGVNDAPAIKEADIGVAMGVGGSDVTKEAGDLILLDDNFATLVAAVEEGRVIYANIRKFIRYLLACNIGEVLTMFLGILMGFPVVLLPIQILLVNLVTDGLPAIALGLEPAEEDIMKKRPRRRNDGIFSEGLLSVILFRGVLIGLTTLAVFSVFFGRYHDVDTARTAAFLTLVLTQLIHVFECKSEHRSLLELNYLGNPKLIGAVLLSAAVVFAAVYLSPLQTLFGTVPLSAGDLGVTALFCLAVPLISSVVQALRNRFSFFRKEK